MYTILIPLYLLDSTVVLLDNTAGERPNGSHISSERMTYKNLYFSEMRVEWVIVVIGRPR